MPMRALAVGAIDQPRTPCSRISAKVFEGDPFPMIPPIGGQGKPPPLKSSP